MTRNKYGATRLTVRKADSMRNPAYVSLPKGSMKNKSILSTLARAADAGIGRYSVRNEKPSAMLSMKTIDRLAESVSPLVLMQMFKDKVRPAKTTKRKSSVRKADSMRNPAYTSLPKTPMKTLSPFGEFMTNVRRPSKDDQLNRLNNAINYNFDLMERNPFLKEMRRKAIEEGRIPLTTYDYQSSSGRGLRASPTVTPTPVSKRKASVRKANSMSTPSYSFSSSTKTDSMRNPAYASIPRLSGGRYKMTLPSKQTSFFKADSMRNPEYIDIKRTPAVERMSDKVRARVNRTIGSNPLESVLEILQGKDTRNMINAQRNRNSYYNRKGEEISANYAREKRIPEYTRLPKGSITPNMKTRIQEAVSRIGANIPDPAQRLMTILQSPSVIARVFEQSQGKSKN